MNVKDMKEDLNDIPDDYNVCVINKVEVLEDDIRLHIDKPIKAIVVSTQDKELLFFTNFMDYINAGSSCKCNRF